MGRDTLSIDRPENKRKDQSRMPEGVAGSGADCSPAGEREDAILERVQPPDKRNITQITKVLETL